MRYRHADVLGATCFFTINVAGRKGQVLLDHVQRLLEFTPFTPTYQAVHGLGGAGPHAACAAVASI